ncbi:hypothetical protein B0T25DRAFT_124357 [Lasiosphaeria hispida]|uniref:Uncharacterized protein n=1 Tax=Lasiosphaeria hispida TaxID=260671 RepID=A0AAJ0MID9_9PEZI|nr:hypothetical protein B0T25DRAFT_124357 [Lasiosphaeria hispida]
MRPQEIARACCAASMAGRSWAGSMVHGPWKLSKLSRSRRPCWPACQPPCWPVQSSWAIVEIASTRETDRQASDSRDSGDSRDSRDSNSPETQQDADTEACFFLFSFFAAHPDRETCPGRGRRPALARLARLAARGSRGGLRRPSAPVPWLVFLQVW